MSGTKKRYKSEKKHEAYHIGFNSIACHVRAGSLCEMCIRDSLKAVEAEDTAGSAAYIAQHKVRGWAAICSSYAAHMYGMKVLQEMCIRDSS